MPPCACRRPAVRTAVCEPALNVVCCGRLYEMSEATTQGCGPACIQARGSSTTSAHYAIIVPEPLPHTPRPHVDRQPCAWSSDTQSAPTFLFVDRERADARRLRPHALPCRAHTDGAHRSRLWGSCLLQSETTMGTAGGRHAAWGYAGAAMACHRSGVEGQFCCAPCKAMHGAATSLRLPAHGLQTNKLEHFECPTTMGTAGGRNAVWGYAGAALAQ